MVKKIKNRQKQKLKKTQKQKKRQEKNKKQVLSSQVTSRLNVEDMVDYALELVENGDWNGGETDSYVVHHAQDMLSRLEKQIQNNDNVNLDGYLKGHQTFKQGMKYMESGNWDAAAAKFNDTIEITPNNPQSYGNLGICYASIGKIQRALESFDRAVELDPNYEPALLNRKIVEFLSVKQVRNGRFCGSGNLVSGKDFNQRKPAAQKRFQYRQGRGNN